MKSILDDSELEFLKQSIVKESDGSNGYPSDKILYCLAVSYKCLYEQFINSQKVDFSEACRHCKYLKNCNGNFKPMHEYCQNILQMPVRMIIEEGE